MTNGNHVLDPQRTTGVFLTRQWFERLAAAAIALSGPAPLQARTQSRTLPTITELHDADRAVGVVGIRLAVAARGFCKARQGSAGIVLDDAARYGPGWRAAEATLLGTATAPAIVALVQGGPAERAGARVGDAITMVDTWKVPEAGDTDRSEAVLDHIEQVVPPHALALQVRRAGEAMSLRIIPEWSCRTRFQVLPGGAAQAQANGDRVEIGSELVRKTNNEDELAVVLAHELAHNILDHHARLASAGAFGTGRPSRAAVRLIYATEIEADRLSVYICDRAGFSLAAFGSLWRRLGSGRARGGEHPPTARRLELMEAQIGRVRAARAAGQVPRPEDLDAFLRPSD